FAEDLGGVSRITRMDYAELDVHDSSSRVVSMQMIVDEIDSNLLLAKSLYVVNQSVHAKHYSVSVSRIMDSFRQLQRVILDG
ncbi:hypothetical protein BGZ68_002961, partial [Mortierella alpina]